MAPSVFYLTLASCVVALAVGDMMRAEVRDASVALHLGAHGEFQRLGEASAMREKIGDMCDIFFPMGKEDKDECVYPTYGETQVMDRNQCRDAAKQHHNGIQKTRFLLDYNWFNVHPKGCFAAPCDASIVNKTFHEAAGDDHVANVTAKMAEEQEDIHNPGDCYYYNPTGPDPDVNNSAFSGTPVCERRKYIKGDELFQEKEPCGAEEACSDGCQTHNFTTPDGTRAYERIYNEDQCKKVAECLGLATERSDFRVGIDDSQLAKKKKYPRGCFIAQDKEVYFNSIYSPGNTTHPMEWEPTPSTGWAGGTPLCVVTEYALTEWSTHDADGRIG